MATPSQIDEQVKLEREQIRKGIDILRDNTQNLESKSYSSATIYGVTSIRDLLPLVIEQIETRKDMLKRGHNGVAFKDVYKYLDSVDTNVLASITCKVVMDKVFSTRDKSNY